MFTTLPSTTQRKLYADAWAVPQYRDTSPGADVVEWLLTEWPALVLPPGASVLDAGCGTGRAGLKFAQAGHNVSLTDLTFDGLDPAACLLPHFPAVLWQDWALGQTWDLVFCVDVLEHIPVEFTMLVAARLLEAGRQVFIQVANWPDLGFSPLVGEELHPTVQTFTWWRDRLSDLGGRMLDARDLMQRSAFLLEGCG